MTLASPSSAVHLVNWIRGLPKKTEASQPTALIHTQTDDGTRRAGEREITGEGEREPMSKQKKWR